MELTNKNFLEREYKEWGILVFIKEVLKKIEEVEGKYIIKNVLTPNDNELIKDLLNNTNIFTLYNDERYETDFGPYPGTNFYIVNIENLKKIFNKTLQAINKNNYEKEYQEEILKDFFNKYSIKKAIGKSIKYPQEFSFEEEVYNNLDYIKTMFLLWKEGFLKIGNINSGLILPENEELYDSYIKDCFYINNKKDHYIKFYLKIEGVILNFSEIEFNLYTKSLKICGKEIMTNGNINEYKGNLKDDKIKIGICALYGIFKAGKQEGNKLFLERNDEIEKSYNNFYEEAYIKFGFGNKNKEVKVEEPFRGGRLIKEFGNNLFDVSNKNSDFLINISLIK